jgi:hypothetical protein
LLNVVCRGLPIGAHEGAAYLQPNGRGGRAGRSAEKMGMNGGSNRTGSPRWR